MIRQIFLILTVLMLAFLLMIGRAIGQDVRVPTPQHCLYAADMALVAASFAPHVASEEALLAGVDQSYLPEEVSAIVAGRIVSRAWARKSENPPIRPREWATKMRDSCLERGGDMNSILAGPT